MLLKIPYLWYLAAILNALPLSKILKQGIMVKVLPRMNKISQKHEIAYIKFIPFIGKAKLGCVSNCP